MAASRCRIQDADFAAETAALSRAQVLQQAGTAMVAQANQLPQQVLSLLKGCRQRPTLLPVRAAWRKPAALLLFPFAVR